jgi:hypothetical protein
MIYDKIELSWINMFFSDVVGKLFSEVLANRLAQKLENMVHPCQSAFIKGKCIQYNFKLVQGSARPLHT